MARVVLAIDQGTTGTTLALMDARGRLLDSVNHEFPQLYPQPGWVSHDAEAIWSSVLAGIRVLLRRAKVSATDIVAIGITNQRETAMLWDRITGEPLDYAIVWQCRRTTPFTEKLKRAGYESEVRARTGLVLDPYFSASKFRWLLANNTDAKRRARQGQVCAGTIDSFLLWRLSGGEKHITDVSNASRTSLMNLQTLDWDPELLRLFEVPREVLPDIVDSSGQLAVTRRVPGLPDGIPISGCAGDQQSALFGQACFQAGDAKCTFGTGSFILMNTGSRPRESTAGLLSTVAWRLGDGRVAYALEGGAFVCGAAVQWLRDQLQVIASAADIEALASQVNDSGGVDFVPALTGLGAPHWDPDARGLISGITRGTTSAHIARATLDAMALQNTDILLAMEADTGRRLRRLRVDGGAAANDLLMQLQADYLGRDIVRPKVIETTVAGACFLAGLGVGLWPSTEKIAEVWRSDRTFSASLKPAARRARRLQWSRAIGRTVTP